VARPDNIQHLRKPVPSEALVKHHNPLKNRNLQITIDKRSDRRYDLVCCLEETSLTPPAAPALTLDGSYCYKLFVVAENINSFGIKQIQTLCTKHPDGGYRDSRFIRPLLTTHDSPTLL